MRLLIITQKIDERDDVLGFMHGWVAEFARQTEKVSVICLEKGRVNLPGNVKVFSLGKESLGFGNWDLEIFRRAVYAVRFWYYILSARRSYDAVFVHMNPEYIVLGGLFWKLWGKTVTLWYAHKSTPWHLRVALLFTDIVFTSTASGFRVPSGKVRVIGQGIDIEKFKVKSEKLKVKDGKGIFKIVTVGRITPSKDYDTLIDAIELVRKEPLVPVEVSIIGASAVSSDDTYCKHLKEKIARKGLSDIIHFKGAVPNATLPGILPQYDLFVNMGRTGSMDKAVPEAMAMGLPVLTCNEAFKEVLGPFRGDLMYPKGDFRALASGIARVIGLPLGERIELGEGLRELVVRNHSLSAFVKKVIGAIASYKLK